MWFYSCSSAFLPVDDVWNKTLGSNVTGDLSPATQYLIRSLPLAAVAILDSAIVLIILGPMTTTDWATLMGAWLCSLVAVPTGLTLGLAISVASLRTDLHNLVHNATNLIFLSIAKKLKTRHEEEMLL